ncbi:MAG: cytochrome c oxidase subunit II [Betaproteobacteria bacterium]|nr:cytochrome c oxidase subunit II [Betaproteobacteria bacterium]
MPGGPMVNQWNLPEPANAIARGQIWLHEVLMWVCVLIFIGVFAVMFYSIWAHRKSRGAKSADFHESTTVEIVWTVVPFLIVVGLGIAATGEVIAQKDTSNPDLTIKVTGYQWKWGYDYLKGDGEGIAFLSNLSTPREQIEDRNYPDARAKREANPTYLMEVDNPLVVPADKKVRLVITANDVIHSYYVPRLGIKQDAIPGFIRDTWFRADKPGVYRGACTELCGKDHAFMPIVVEAKSDADYRKWVEEKKKEMLARADDPNKEWTVADLSARGEKVYAANCVACHQANGKGVAGAFPALEGSKLVLGKRDDHIAIMLNGKAGTAMASFKGLSDTELAAVITYARNAWGNKAEDNLVQPQAVKAARK